MNQGQVIQRIIEANAKEFREHAQTAARVFGEWASDPEYADFFNGLRLKCKKLIEAAGGLEGTGTINPEMLATTGLMFDEIAKISGQEDGNFQYAANANILVLAMNNSAVRVCSRINEYENLPTSELPS